jgi:hypothetical protein
VQRCRPRLEALEDRCLPSTLYVTSPLDDGSRGTLRYDIAHAGSGDTIVMSPTLTAPIVLTQGELLLKKSLTIEGQANQPETISGNHNSRVFEVAAKTSVTLIGLDITGGNGVANNPGGATGNASGGGGGGSSGRDGQGGGILNFGTLTVSNCTLSGNSVNDASVYVCEGGAIFNIAGTVNVSNSTLSGNSAGFGGAIYNYSGLIEVTNSVFSGNSPDNIYGPYTDGGGNTGLP